MAPTASIIFLHGLGDSGSGWSSLQYEAPVSWSRWSFPDAPKQPVSCNGGVQMPSWFDIQDLPLGERESRGAPRGIEASVSAVHAMLRQSESLGFSAERTILGGFSQGAALSLLAGLTYEKPLAGVVALSGWAMRRDELPGIITQKEVPIFLGHGDQDPTVPLKLGVLAEETLKALGCTQVEMHRYRGLGHSASREEFRDIHRFFQRQLPERFEPTAKIASQSADASAAPRATSRTAIKCATGKTSVMSVQHHRPEFVFVKEDHTLRILIELPRVSEISDLTVDLAARVLHLNGQASRYRLELVLPFQVDPERASTKFSRRRHLLEISAPT
eukprot:TRINITY_DN65360_c0_g1_i1.p1 TRINITY_DN65360_c0_g1~~TRINITY_DN65360_c0_g1_i1.p1  ORF type:complete len:331 (-),score=66.68 TRINITY_DN65360_c0_g1_i1:72-1064(-)